MGQVKQYNREYKEEAIKLVEEKGVQKSQRRVKDIIPYPVWLGKGGP